jgi:hypothetical protein
MKLKKLIKDLQNLDKQGYGKFKVEVFTPWVDERDTIKFVSVEPDYKTITLYIKDE